MKQVYFHFNCLRSKPESKIIAFVDKKKTFFLRMFKRFFILYSSIFYHSNFERKFKYVNFQYVNLSFLIKLGERKEKQVFYFHFSLSS